VVEYGPDKTGVPGPIPGSRILRGFMLNFITTNGQATKMKKLKYKQYICSYGTIVVYENGEVEFVPFKSVELNDEVYGTDQEDLDFENGEACELIAEDEEEFEEE
jgi:hypothetical protein